MPDLWSPAAVGACENAEPTPFWIQSTPRTQRQRKRPPRPRQSASKCPPPRSSLALPFTQFRHPLRGGAGLGTETASEAQHRLGAQGRDWGSSKSPPAPPTTPAVAAHAVRPIASLFRSPVRLRSWQQPNTTGHALANIALHRGMHPRWPERSRGSSGLAGRTRGRRGPPWWSCAPCPSRQPGPSSASSPPPAGRAGAGRAPSPTRGSSRHRPAGELSADDQQAGDEALESEALVAMSQCTPLSRPKAPKATWGCGRRHSLGREA